MFLWLVGFFLLLGALVYWHSVKTANHFHEEKLKLIRKRIEENDKKKFLEKLNTNKNILDSTLNKTSKDLGENKTHSKK